MKVEYDWYQTFTDFFVIKWRKAVESNLLILRKSVKEIDKLIADEKQSPIREVLIRDKEKMQESIKYYVWLDRLIDAMEDGTIFELVPREE